MEKRPLRWQSWYRRQNPDNVTIITTGWNITMVIWQLENIMQQ